MKVRIQTICASAGILAPVVFLSVVVVTARAYPGYRHAGRALSDLGMGQSPLGSLMNLAGFGLAGTLVMAFGVGFGVALRWSGRAVAALVAWVIAGALFMGLGVWPYPNPIHVEMVLLLSAWVGFAVVVGAFALGQEARSVWLWPTTALAVIASAALPLVALVPRNQLGSFQRFCASLVGIWVVMAAFHIRAIDTLRSDRLNPSHARVTDRAQSNTLRPPS